MPIDTLLVFEMNDENNLEGGSGEDLANQITNVLQKRLEIDEEKMITSERGYLLLRSSFDWGENLLKKKAMEEAGSSSSSF